MPNPWTSAALARKPPATPRKPPATGKGSPDTPRAVAVPQNAAERPTRYADDDPEAPGRPIRTYRRLPPDLAQALDKTFTDYLKAQQNAI